MSRVKKIRDYIPIREGLINSKGLTYNQNKTVLPDDWTIHDSIDQQVKLAYDTGKGSKAMYTDINQEPIVHVEVKVEEKLGRKVINLIMENQ